MVMADGCLLFCAGWLRATGARQIATGLAELRRRKQKACYSDVLSGFGLADRLLPQVLVTSMCIGTGMGAAAVFVNEDLD